MKHEQTKNLVKTWKNVEMYQFVKNSILCRPIKQDLNLQIWTSYKLDFKTTPISNIERGFKKYN